MPARALLAGVLFFLSGAAALVYQVVWQRILALQSGVGIYSIAVIVAAFMVGLGLGSHAGGLLCERRSARSALLTFALVEIGIAVGFVGVFFLSFLSFAKVFPGALPAK